MDPLSSGPRAIDFIYERNSHANSHRPQNPARAFGAVLTIVPPVHAEDPIVKLVNAQSGKCLQPVNGSADQGAAIVQQTCNGTANQQWSVTFVSSTKVHLKNRATGMCMDARGKAVNGTPIQQWTCNKITNENWNFGITNNLLSLVVSNTYSHCVASPGTQDGLAMELRVCNIIPAQIWSRPPG